MAISATNMFGWWPIMGTWRSGPLQCSDLLFSTTNAFCLWHTIWTRKSEWLQCSDLLFSAATHFAQDTWLKYKHVDHCNVPIWRFLVQTHFSQDTWLGHQDLDHCSELVISASKAFCYWHMIGKCKSKHCNDPILKFLLQTRFAYDTWLDHEDLDHCNFSIPQFLL